MKGEKLQMRINLLSSFAAGILITTTICSAVYIFDKGNTAKTSEKIIVKQTNAQPSETDMKNKLSSVGYVVQTKDEYDKTINDAKAAAQKGAAPDPNKPVSKVVLNVSNGMTSIDIGRALQKANIVPDAYAFSKDIEGKGLQKKLRPGIYEVDSSMTYDQVVSTIFK
jgi:hypothetical protein